MKRSHLTTLLAIGAVAILCIVIGISGEREPTAQIVRIAYLPIAPDTSFFVAQEKGLFVAQGLTIEPIKVQSSNQALEALVAGRVDATAIVALETALAVNSVTPGEFRIVEMTAATEDSHVHQILVRNDSEIATLADLEGKTIATFPGSQMEAFLRLVLGRFVTDMSTVSITQMKPDLQPQALSSGQVDAVFCLEPVGTLIESKGIGHAISVNPLYEYILKPFPTAVALVSDELASKNHDLAEAYATALNMAHDFIRENPVESATILSKYVPVDEALAPKVGLYDYWGVPEVDMTAVDALVKLYVENGILDTEVGVKELMFAGARSQQE